MNCCRSSFAVCCDVTWGQYLKEGKRMSDLVIFTCNFSRLTKVLPRIITILNATPLMLCILSRHCQPLNWIEFWPTWIACLQTSPDSSYNVSYKPILRRHWAASQRVTEGRRMTLLKQIIGGQIQFLQRRLGTRAYSSCKRSLRGLKAHRTPLPCVWHRIPIFLARLSGVVGRIQFYKLSLLRQHN